MAGGQRFVFISSVKLDNLVDLIVTCIEHPAAAHQTFLVSDGEDLNTTELLQRTAEALKVPARLTPVPAWLLELGLKLLGKQDLARRLLRSLQVDMSKTQELLEKCFCSIWANPSGSATWQRR